MTGKDVWRWILPKFDNDLIFIIYEKTKAVCKGFRINTIKDVAEHRNKAVSDLLNKDNYGKLILWFAENPPVPLNGISLADKECNELVDIASEKGAPNVLVKLFCESQEKKAIQFFAFLQDEQSSLLEIPNQSIRALDTDPTQSNKEEDEQKGESKEDESKENESKENEPKDTNKQIQKTETASNDGKKVQKLAQKVKNLNDELKKRDDLHKAKMAEAERNHQHTIQKLNEKNQLNSKLIKEKESLKKTYEEEKSKWEIERNEYKEMIELFQEEVSKLQEQLAQAATEQKPVGKNKFQFLVIGKPANTSRFQSEMIEFTFVERKDVHDYAFSKDFDAYLVLFYDLNPRDQFLLKYNDSYAQLDGNKVFICKDFIDVKKQMDHFNRLEERVM